LDSSGVVLLLTSLHGNDSADGVLVLSTDLSHRDCLLTSLLVLLLFWHAPSV